MPDVTQHPIFEPDGAITVYKNVPLDKSYEHSVNYSTQAAFVTALSAYTHTTLSNQSYSRLTQSSVRVELSFSYLKDCNYMMITDANLYGGKVYFCFIDKVEYINNVTCDIFFTIDVLQTYYHDFTMRENFVEREHCLLSDDVVGKNIVPENLELGDYTVVNYVNKPYVTTRRYNIIMYVPNTDESNAYVYYDASTDSVARGIATADQFKPGLRNGFGDFPCCLAIPVTTSGNENVNHAINLLIEANAKIIGAFQICGEMYDDNFIETTYYPHITVFDETLAFKKLDGTAVTNIKNKKLFNSPFKKLIISNNNGQQNEYKWELFDTRYQNTIRANIHNANAMTPYPVGTMYPSHYRGLVEDVENSVVFDDFIQLNYSEDSYTKWWAQNKTNFGISLATQSLMTGLTLASAGASLGSAYATNKGAFSLGMGAMGIGRTLSQLTTAKATPDNAIIQKNTSILNALQGKLGFTIYDVGVCGEMAEIIDNYFEMYGYATHKVKIPNFISNGRPVWDYVKLQACQIEARTSGEGLNGEYIDQIQSIFNNGITLWKSLANVGNYSLDNHTT